MREKTGPLKGKPKAILGRQHTLKTMKNDLQIKIKFDSECVWNTEEKKMDVL